jgi:hypothetical protein
MLFLPDRTSFDCDSVDPASVSRARKSNAGGCCLSVQIKTRRHCLQVSKKLSSNDYQILTRFSGEK